MTPSKVRDTADGRVYLAEEALSLGLIGGVMRLDQAIEAPRKVKAAAGSAVGAAGRPRAEDG